MKCIEAKELKNKDGINIIDIRDTLKYNQNHIKDAKNIPMQLLLMDPSKYLNTEETYYIYCDQGIRSRETCRRLLVKGYDVVDVLGGYKSWIEEA